MNIVKFARLISYITSWSKIIPEYQIEDIRVMIEQLNGPTTVDANDINTILSAMKENRFIDAIKAYRSLTGLGLKESKDAIEKYRPYVSIPQ